MRAGLGLMAVFLTRVPGRHPCGVGFVLFFIVSQAKLESLRALQSTAPICPAGVNWFGLVYSELGTPQRQLLSAEDGPGERGVLEKCLQGGTGEVFCSTAVSL